MNASSTRRRLVIGNWKMHGSLERNAALLSALAGGAARATDCELAVCAPFPYLAQASEALRGTPVSWGAQNVSEHGQGAHTGEVSADMLRDFDCRWVIVGHSERRAGHGESSELVARKAAVALDAGLTPVVCVGESLSEQEAGRTMDVVGAQLQPVLDLGVASVSRLVLAYEPVWAIGTGRVATPDQAQAVHGEIRARLLALGAGQVRILYGGSVKAGNAAELFAMPDIDGGLIGGASLDAQEFLRIAAA